MNKAVENNILVLEKAYSCAGYSLQQLKTFAQIATQDTCPIISYVVYDDLHLQFLRSGQVTICPTSTCDSSTMLPKNEQQLFWKISSSVDSSSSSSHSVRCIETGAQSLQLPLAACTWTLGIPFSQINQILAWYIGVAVMILLQCVSDEVQHSKLEVLVEQHGQPVVNTSGR